MKVLNFYGGAGIGKSTIAADIFSKLKRKGHKTELVGESFETLLQKAPVFVPQSFTCPNCGKEFAYDMGIRRVDRTDWRSKNRLPMGEVRVFDD